MSRFIVKHEHPAEKCPAGHPEMGPMLLKHISPPNASSAGITVHGDAVVDGEHIFYLLLEAQDKEKITQFMAPFAQAGTVEIWPTSSCEQVVDRGKC